MIFDHIQWDEHNLEHATQRLTAAEIEQAIWNATSWQKHPTSEDRRLVRSVTDGGSGCWWSFRWSEMGSAPLLGGRSDNRA